MNVYTRLGVHDLAGALDRMPAVGGNEPDRENLRATGTDDAAASSPWMDNSSTGDSSSRAIERGTAQRTEGAPRRHPIPFAARKSCPVRDKDQRRAVQRGVMQKVPCVGLEPTTR